MVAVSSVLASGKLAPASAGRLALTPKPGGASRLMPVLGMVPTFQITMPLPRTGETTSCAAARVSVMSPSNSYRGVVHMSGVRNSP